MEIRIDRLKLLFDIAELEPEHLEDLVTFEAVIKFSDGSVRVAGPKFSRSAVIAAAHNLIKECQPKETLPPACRQSAREAAELWAIGEEVESSEWLCREKEVFFLVAEEKISDKKTEKMANTPQQMPV